MSQHSIIENQMFGPKVLIKNLLQLDLFKNVFMALSHLWLSPGMGRGKYGENSRLGPKLKVPPRYFPDGT